MSRRAAVCRSGRLRLDEDGRVWIEGDDDECLGPVERAFGDERLGAGDERDRDFLEATWRADRDAREGHLAEWAAVFYGGLA